MSRVDAVVLGGMLGSFLGVTAAMAQAPRTLSFQGRLVDNGVPITVVNNAFIDLYDAPSGGNQVHSENEALVPDANGTFVATLGDGATLDAADFHQELWAEVRVDTGGGLQTLAPRIPLAAAPYALSASQAEGLAVKNLVVLSNSDGGGGPSVQAALDAITDASPGNDYVILLGPGYWDVGSLTMKSNVTLLGMGRKATQVGSQGFSSSTSAVVHMVDQARLQDLTVNCFAAFEGNSHCKGVAFTSGEGELDRVTVWSSGATTANVGIQVDGTGADPEIRAVEASAQTTTGEAIGLQVSGGAEVIVIDSLLEASTSGSGAAYGAQVTGNSQLVGRNSEFIGEGESGSSGDTFGIDADTPSIVATFGGFVEAFRSGPGGNCSALQLVSAPFVLLNGTFLHGECAGGLNYGIDTGVGASSISLEGVTTRIEGGSGNVGFRLNNSGDELRVIGGSVTADTGFLINDAGVSAAMVGAALDASTGATGSAAPTCLSVLLNGSPDTSGNCGHVP